MASEKNLEENEEKNLLDKKCEAHSDYAPKILELGKKHPINLCEGSALSCVSPPPIQYELRMEETFYNGTDPLLSNAQLEAVVYACQSFRTFVFGEENQKLRRGFYLGDGTGAGKTRTLAAVTYECYLAKGVEKVLWVTVNNQLFEYVMREIRNFVPCAVRDLIKGTSEEPKTANLSKTKPTLSQSPEERKLHVLLITYSSLTGEQNEKALKEWLGTDYKGLMIFDEAHNARAGEDANKPSKSGKKVIQLQCDCPGARVIYSSATGASEHHHLLYMTRLGLWGPGTEFPSSEEFLNRLKARGTPGLELLAIEMKMRGVFLARQISYYGVNIHVEEVESRESFVAVYERACQLWGLLVEYQERLGKECMAGNKSQARSVAGSKGPFWGAAQNFFVSLIMSSKIRKTVKMTTDAINANKSVVIGLQKTGNSRYGDFIKEDWNKGYPYSNCAEVLRLAMLSLGIEIGCPKAFFKDNRYVRIGGWKRKDQEMYIAKLKQADRWEDFERKAVASRNEAEVRITSHETFNFETFPYYSIGRVIKKSEVDLKDASKLSWSIQEVSNDLTPEGLARLFHELYWWLPINPLDELICRLTQHVPVAELTGRTYSYECDEERVWTPGKKASMEKEIAEFNKGDKRACIISEVASTGFSLHADNNIPNKQPRVHITIEFAWGPEKVIQQLGRTHRSNQASVPCYKLILSDVPGEIRMLSVVTKRIKQMGAVCHGQSLSHPLVKTTTSDLVVSETGLECIKKTIEEFKLDSEAKWWAERVIMEVKERKRGQREFFVRTDDVSKILNRLMMIPIHYQKKFMNILGRTLAKVSENAKKESSYIVEYPAKGTDIKLLEQFELNLLPLPCTAYKFRLSRVTSREMIEEYYKKDTKNNGFRMLKKNPNSKQESLVFAVQDDEQFSNICYPYSSAMRRVRTDSLRKYNYLKGMSEWETALREMLKKPGCTHTIQDGCTNVNCRFNWGVVEFMLFTGFSSQILQTLERGNPRAKIVLARVTYKENLNEKRIVGVYRNYNDNLMKTIRDNFTTN